MLSCCTQQFAQVYVGPVDICNRDSSRRVWIQFPLANLWVEKIILKYKNITTTAVLATATDSPGQYTKSTVPIFTKPTFALPGGKGWKMHLYDCANVSLKLRCSCSNPPQFVARLKASDNVGSCCWTSGFKSAWGSHLRNWKEKEKKVTWDARFLSVSINACLHSSKDL